MGSALVDVDVLCKGPVSWTDSKLELYCHMYNRQKQYDFFNYNNERELARQKGIREIDFEKEWKKKREKNKDREDDDNSETNDNISTSSKTSKKSSIRRSIRYDYKEASTNETIITNNNDEHKQKAGPSKTSSKNSSKTTSRTVSPKPPKTPSSKNSSNSNSSKKSEKNS